MCTPSVPLNGPVRFTDLWKRVCGFILASGCTGSRHKCGTRQESSQLGVRCCRWQLWRLIPQQWCGEDRMILQRTSRVSRSWARRWDTLITSLCSWRCSVPNTERSWTTFQWLKMCSVHGCCRCTARPQGPTTSSESWSPRQQRPLVRGMTVGSGVPVQRSSNLPRSRGRGGAGRFHADGVGRHRVAFSPQSEGTSLLGELGRLFTIHRRAPSQRGSATRGTVGCGSRPTLDSTMPLRNLDEHSQV